MAGWPWPSLVPVPRSRCGHARGYVLVRGVDPAVAVGLTAFHALYSTVLPILLAELACLILSLVLPVALRGLEPLATLPCSGGLPGWDGGSEPTPARRAASPPLRPPNFMITETNPRNSAD